MSLFRRTVFVPLDDLGLPPLKVTIEQLLAPPREEDEIPWEVLASLPAADRLKAMGAAFRRENGIVIPPDDVLEAATLLALAANGPLHTAGITQALWVAFQLPGSLRMDLAKAANRVINLLSKRVVGADHLVVKSAAKSPRKRGQPKEPQWAITAAGDKWMRWKLCWLVA